VDEADVASSLGHQRQYGGHVAADGVAGDGDAGGVEPVCGAVAAEVLGDRVALLEREREAGDG
jgi:hypothetical protein